MENRTLLTTATLRKVFGWATLCLGIVLVVFGLGSITLQIFDRRYRDLTTYIAIGIFVLLCIVCSLYLAARGAHRLRGFLWRSLLGLLLAAVLAGVSTGMFMFHYSGEMHNDGWYAPPDKIVFNDGFLARRHIVVYEPGNLLWTGPFLPEYEYID